MRARIEESLRKISAVTAIFISPIMVSAAEIDLDAVKQTFVSGIASQYRYEEYPWAFLDTTNCFKEHSTCSGTNPDSPYGYVAFTPRSMATRMAETDALVLIMKTPPPMRYFALTPYLYSRYYPSLPASPEQSGVVKVFESLGDSVNMTNIHTMGSSAPGQNAFSQLSAFVVTADAKSLEQIREQLVAQGVPDYAINQIVLPLNAVPLRMGKDAGADTFGVLLRIAYPEDATQMADYITGNPARALMLSPLQSRDTDVLPAPVSKKPGNGVMEPAELADARDRLARDLLARYSGDYHIREQAVEYAQTINYVCITLGTQCGGDNPDAIYGRDLQNYIPISRNDKVLVIGVNHVDTGKARYISHAIVNTEHLAGVAAASDSELQGTALLMAGITDPNDPRYAAYSRLYAFTVSYNCDGEPACQSIPEPTSIDPAGVPFGDALNLTSRYYVDPATGTRPSLGEVRRHRVFVMKKK